MPSARAPSVPGRMGSHQSLRAAVLLRYGSMVTIRAPRLRASYMIVQRWILVTLVFEPQLMMYREWTTVSGSMAARVPSVISHPATPAVGQIVRSRRDGPRRGENRRARGVHPGFSEG